MRKLLFVLPLVLLAALALPNVSHASAATCKVSAAGGEKAPDVEGDNSINEAASQGYSCNVQWAADVQPLFEVGGVWQYCTECAPVFHPQTPDTFYAANSGHNWGLFDWFATAMNDTPVCNFNWELQVNFFGPNHVVFQSDTSPVWHKQPC